MTDKVHLTDAELRELLHLMSHDLRNPLAAIVTNLEFARRLLSRLSVDPDLAESVDDSVTACDVLRRIVANFDVLVKGREVSVTLHELDISAVVEDVAKRCTDRAAQASMTLDVQTDSDVRTMLDKSLFALGVENLIANSIQHGPRRSIVRVELRRRGDCAELTISDDGPAIAEELREAALGPAGHTNSGRTDGTRYGRGLGLLAANTSLSACGCTLTASGTETSKFVVSIPLLMT